MVQMYTEAEKSIYVLLFAQNFGLKSASYNIYLKRVKKCKKHWKIYLHYDKIHILRNLCANEGHLLGG